MAGVKLCFFWWPKTMCLALIISNVNPEIIYEHNLLAVSHSSPAGIQVSLTASHGGELFCKRFSNLSLPLECGENFSRCQDLVVVSNRLDKNVTQFVAAIPVTRAVLLLDIRDNGSGLLLHNSSILSQNIEDCNPTAIFKIAKSIYTMCFNEHTSFLTVIELRIRDLGSIEKAFFVRPTLLGGRFDIADQISNFLSINSTDEIYVVFVSGTTLTTYAPINTATLPTDIPIQCSPQRIEHASGVVVAYCSDHSLSIDIVSQKTNITFYNESGYPFVCPDYPHIKVFAFHSNETYLQYQDLQGSRNLTKVIPITAGNSSSFDDSKCLGTGTTFFVYSDNGGIHVVNITSGREFNLSSYGYPNPSCLNVLGGRYLIIQEAQNGTEAKISIFDSHQNLAKVVRTQSQKADLMAVILTSRSIEPSLSPTLTMTADISTHLASTPQTTPVVPIATPTVPLATAQSVPVGVVVVLAVVGAVVVAGAVIFGRNLLLRRFRGQGKRCPLLLCCPNPRRPVQEVGDPELEDVHEHEETSLLSQPCAAESDSEVSSIDRRGSEASSCIRPSEQEPDNEQRSQMVPGTDLPS